MKLDLASGVDIEIKLERNYDYWINWKKNWNDKGVF